MRIHVKLRGARGLAAPAFASAALVLALSTPSAAQGGAPAGSLYDLPITGVDDAGRTVRIDLFRGSPVLVSMFYSSCPQACPLLVAGIHRALSGMEEPARGKVRVLLVSLDPATDTPAAMKALRERHALDPAQWELVRVEEAQVQELAAVLGIKYRRLPDGAIRHSTSVSVLDAGGRIAGRVDGVDIGEEAAKSLRAALAKAGAP